MLRIILKTESVRRPYLTVWGDDYGVETERNHRFLLRKDGRLNMMRGFWGRAALAAALVAGGLVSAGGAPATAARAGASASLGACWLSNLGFGLGEDTNAMDYVTRWWGGAIQTIIHGPMPRARYWSLTIYHARKGAMVSYYDQQIMAKSSGSSFTFSIGGSRSSKGVWIDPTAGGADAEGYLFLRAYKVSGKVSLPTVSYASSGSLPSTLTSCSAMTSELRATLTKASKDHPAKGQTVGQTAKRKLWPQNADPYAVWSQTVDAAKSVPASDVNKVPLLTQLADPNVIYHAVFFNITRGDMILVGTLPPVSSKAPASGVRYMSMCIYPNDQSHAPLGCLDDSRIKTDSKGQFEVVISPDRPDDTSNWLNPGDTQTGALILRWVLPARGAQANFCLPGLLYRQPGDTVVPPLPAGC